MAQWITKIGPNGGKTITRVRPEDTPAKKASSPAKKKAPAKATPKQEDN